MISLNKPQVFPEYYKYTDYDRIPSGLKKLDFIISRIFRNQGKRPNLEIKVLDIGCGNGNVSIPLGGLGYSVCGMDIDPASLGKARYRNRFPNLKFLIGDAESIGLQETFDFIICSELLEHLKEPERCLNLLRKLLPEGGFLILTIPNGYGPYELAGVVLKFLKHFSLLKKVLRALITFFFLLKKREKIFSPLLIQTSNPHSPHLNFFNLSRVKKLLSDSGFDILEIKNSDFINGAFRVFGLSFPKKLWKLDCLIADYLPRWLVSGWYLVCRRSENTPEKIVGERFYRIEDIVAK